MTRATTMGFAGLALCGFASNSILCRLALATHEMDAASFTALRLLSGALVLVGLQALSERTTPGVRRLAGSWGSALALVLYALPFSWAYLRLGAGPGAFILFATVQLVMMGWGFVRGERPRAMAWVGIGIGLSGLVWLTLPGSFAPDPLGTASMIVAGVAWAAYTLRGRTSSSSPLAVTAGNFVRALPAVPLLAVGAWAMGIRDISTRAAVLACASGALASGVGYSLWYTALPHLTSTRAAAHQLLVPVLAASGAVAFLAEPVTTRLAGGGTVMILGVFIAVRARAKA